MTKPIPEMTASDIARYWEKVDVRGHDECWNWTATKNKEGYGAFHIAFGDYKSHRVGIMIDGRDPGTLIVRHRCDNPPCCNPAHLETGTPADNAHDRDKRGRGATGDRSGSRAKPECLARGERVNTAKLSAADIPAIRADARALRAIAADYGVSHATIGAVKRREMWLHIT